MGHSVCIYIPEAVALGIAVAVAATEEQAESERLTTMNFLGRLTSQQALRS